MVESVKKHLKQTQVFWLIKTKWCLSRDSSVVHLLWRKRCCTFLVSGQTTIVHQPESKAFWGDSLTKPPFGVTTRRFGRYNCPNGFPWNKGNPLTKPPFGVRSCDVAIIWPELVQLSGSSNDSSQWSFLRRLEKCCVPRKSKSAKLCPLVAGNPLLYIILKTSHFVWSWTSRFFFRISLAELSMVVLDGWNPASVNR